MNKPHELNGLKYRNIKYKIGNKTYRCIIKQIKVEENTIRFDVIYTEKLTESGWVTVENVEIELKCNFTAIYRLGFNPVNWKIYSEAEYQIEIEIFTTDTWFDHAR